MVEKTLSEPEAKPGKKTDKVTAAGNKSVTVQPSAARITADQNDVIITFGRSRLVDERDVVVAGWDSGAEFIAKKSNQPAPEGKVIVNDTFRATGHIEGNNLVIDHFIVRRPWLIGVERAVPERLVTIPIKPTVIYGVVKNGKVESELLYDTLAPGKKKDLVTKITVAYQDYTKDFAREERGIADYHVGDARRSAENIGNLDVDQSGVNLYVRVSDKSDPLKFKGEVRGGDVRITEAIMPDGKAVGLSQDKIVVLPVSDSGGSLSAWLDRHGLQYVPKLLASFTAASTEHSQDQKAKSGSNGVDVDKRNSAQLPSQVTPTTKPAGRPSSHQHRP